MTEQNIRYSTSHLHELVAEIERRVFDGFRVDQRSAFAARRQGSAYVCWFVPTREVLDFDGSDEAYMKINDGLVEALQEENQQLTIQQKWEAEEALNELAAQSQELGMYEVDKEQVKVYSKSELENMEWSEFKKLIDAAGIRGRRRQNLTRDYLIYQEENLK